jgi:hypothetical protein
MAFGPDYSDRGLVFCHPDGAPIHPGRFTKLFQAAIRTTDVPGFVSTTCDTLMQPWL